MKKQFLIIKIILLLFCLNSASSNGNGIDKKQYKVLIIDGQNNHRNMAEASIAMKQYLEETGLFQVDIISTPPKGGNMEEFQPKFTDYKVLIMNYNGDSWSEKTKTEFDHYIKNGGGMVSVHAADNAFPKWPAYNQMIAIGGWGDRNEKSGPYFYYDEATDKMIKDTSAGSGGSHGKQHEFVVKTRSKKHPIMRGLPDAWLHQKDELYDRMRGPAENVTVLATAYSAKEQNGSGRNEPMLMTIKYGKGRVFHTTLGHENYSQKCIGFITTLQRGTEWAASGKVTQSVPTNFPTVNQGVARP